MRDKDRSRRPRRLIVGVLAGIGGMAVAATAIAQGVLLPAPPSLKGIAPPKPDLSAYVADEQALMVLGKALFWDQGMGSQGVACATCHFHAGADSRVKNQMNPGLLDRSKAGFDPDGDTAFGDNLGKYPSGGEAGPNYTLKRSDFPLFQLADEGDRDSAITYETNDVVSSQGAFHGQYVGTYLSTRNPNDRCDQNLDPVYHVGGENVRRVEPRNTPTTINAVYYVRSFWDGRANNFFNGVNPFGQRDINAKVMKFASDGEGWQAVPVAIPNLSLASQAVGPVESDLEMICSGRSLAEFGKKVLPRQPLSQQNVSQRDSVLGPHFSRLTLGRGITGTYAEWVQKAFKPEWWQGGTIPAGQPGEGYTQIQANFSLFWGIAVAQYQASLISDDAKYDKVRAGVAGASFTTQEQQGLDLFRSTAVGCIFCHGGPLFSNATFPAAPNVIDRTPGGTSGAHLIDRGFFNIGVRPTGEDIGLGGTDPFGKPLSLARQWIAKHNDDPSDDALVVDQFSVNACQFTVPLNGDIAGGCMPAASAVKDIEVGVDGAFKTPMLRNVELTGPFFHYGAYASLEEVMDFYNRGGDRRLVAEAGDSRTDTTGLNGGNASNLAGALVPLGLSPVQKASLVAFMKTLTDDRVRCEKAPFDHPSLRVQHGMAGDQHALADLNGDGRPDEQYLDIPAVGADGLPGIRRPCIGTFESKLATD